jgi:hypothetical protein
MDQLPGYRLIQGIPGVNGRPARVVWGLEKCVSLQGLYGSTGRSTHTFAVFMAGRALEQAEEWQQGDYRAHLAG